jgi:hypothetical protein
VHTIAVDHKGKALGTAANLSTITEILRVSSTVFSDEIRIRSSSLSESMLDRTADFTISALLCARSQDAEVTGSVSKKTIKE